MSEIAMMRGSGGMRLMVQSVCDDENCHIIVLVALCAMTNAQSNI